MAPYPFFFRALKTIIMPNFLLLTESEQLKHISALLLVENDKSVVPYLIDYQSHCFDFDPLLLGTTVYKGLRVLFISFNLASRSLDN